MLVDASELAAEAGFVIPIALTDGVWSDCVEWTPQDARRQGVQDTHGRLWDVLTTAYWTIRWSRAPSNPLWFDLKRIPRDGKFQRPVLTTLKFALGPGDQCEPVGTVLLPEED